MIDGIGWGIRSSVNIKDCKDLSVSFNPDDIVLTDEVRSCTFWKSFGKKMEFYPHGVLKSLENMETEHLARCLLQQFKLAGCVIDNLDPIGKLLKAEFSSRADGNVILQKSLQSLSLPEDFPYINSIDLSLQMILLQTPSTKEDCHE
jgi:hypothetical protein